MPDDVSAPIHAFLEFFQHNPDKHFETNPYSKKLQLTTEMWLLKDFDIQIA